MRVLLLLFVIYSCSNGPATPPGIIPPNKMERLLSDVVKADEMTDMLASQDSTYRALAKKTSYYDTILTLHGVDKNLFDKSLEFYQKKPALLKDILQNIQQRLDSSLTRKPAISPQLR